MTTKEKGDLSDDARTVATCCFPHPITVLGFGLQKSRPTGRAIVALTELERAGYIQRIFRDDGGIDYKPLRSLKPLHLPKSKLIDMKLVEPLEERPMTRAGDRGMVEVVAHAVCPHIRRKPCHECPEAVMTSEGEGTQYCRLVAERIARAAIEALRTPTPEMEQEFVRVTGEGRYPSGEGFAPSWSAAIDAALGTGGKA